MKDLTTYSRLLVEILEVRSYEDLMARINTNDIHVGMMIRLGDITSDYERIRLSQDQLDWLIHELSPFQ